MLKFADLMPDCWLEVSLHPEGPATGQLDQGFPWLSLVPEQTLSWYPNSTFHCMLHMSPYTNVTLNFDFDFGMDHPVHGGYGRGHEEERV
jgi:hypothetical protein